MNIKIKLQEFAMRLADSAASKSASGTEKSAGEVGLEKKPGVFSRLRSVSAESFRSAGLGRARKHAESAVPQARFAPIKQESKPTRKTASSVSASMSAPPTETQSRPKRVSFGTPPSKASSLPPQAQQRPKATSIGKPPAEAPTLTPQAKPRASVQVPRAWKQMPKTMPSEEPPLPPGHPSETSKNDKPVTKKTNETASPPDNDGLDSTIDSLLSALNDDDGNNSIDPTSHSGKRGTDGSRAVEHDNNPASPLDDPDKLLEAMNSAIEEGVLLKNALKELENPVNTPNPKT